MRLAKLTWDEARDFNAQLVLLPIGSFEQHGHHLPLDNDGFVAERLSLILAEQLNNQGYRTLVAPTLPIGLSAHHMGFYGSLTLSPETFQSVIQEVCCSLKQHGLDNIVIVNGHGGNSSTIYNAVSSLTGFRGVNVLEYWKHLSPECLKEIESNYFCHACEGETSLSIALGQRANMQRAVTEFPEGSASYNLLDKRPKTGLQLPPLHTISISGVIGNAALGNRVKGERMLADILPELLSSLRNQPTEKVG